MKIKHIFTVMSLALFMGGVTSCDNIDEDDRYAEIPVEKPSTPEEPSTPENPSTPDNPDLIKPVPRVVLLEEFTGQSCSNCPVAHRTISNLLIAYDDQFVPVSIHTTYGNFGLPEPIGLANTEGDYYANKWTLSSLPTGAVDMTQLSDMTEWGTQIAKLVKTESPVDLKLTATIAGDDITVTADMAVADAIEGDLMLWLCESDIVAMQLQPNGSIDGSYVHNHVFRAAMNGLDGQPVKYDTNTNNQVVVTFNIAGRNYDHSHLSVAGFIRKGWNNVIQAGETHVVAE